MKKVQKNPPQRAFQNRVGCAVFVSKEKIPNNGEDAYVYAINPSSALVGVFDGLGGAGAKRYSKCGGKTGAYLASRIAAGTILNWFSSFSAQDNEHSAESIKQALKEAMQFSYDAVGEASGIGGSMVKVFPTTAAFAICSQANNDLHIDCYWAGDSRVYLLNEDGLSQLSADDLTVPDAMENLYKDGVMTNIISKSKDFTIHHGEMRLDKPGILFSATDGCFGYVSTPMEFENILLNSMMKSDSVDGWEQNLSREIGMVAGDDYTLCGLILDFPSFESMKKQLIPRSNFLHRKFLAQIERLGREEKNALWEIYKKDYYRFQMECES